MRAVVAAGITLGPGHPTRRFADALARALTRENPERAKLGRLGRYVGHLPQEVCYLRDLGGGRWWLPGGAAPILQQVAREHGVPLEWASEVAWDPAAAGVPLDALGKRLRPYQEEAIRALASAPRGYAVLPPGAGKTVLGAAGLLHLGQRSLVLAHTIDIVDQWADAIRSLHPTTPVVRVGAGHGPAGHARLTPPRGVCVATVQTLSPAVAEDPGILAGFGLVLLDEVHHVAADSFAAVVGQAPARYRWGLTATPDRADGYGFLLPWFLGPERYRVAYRDLLDRGWLHRPRIVPVWSGVAVERMDAAGAPVPHAGRIGALADDPAFLQGIADVCAAAASVGRVTLALLPRVDAVGAVLRLLRGLGVASAAITGGTDRADRRRRVGQLRRGVLPVTLACQVADEGLDAPRCDCLVSANPGRDPGRAVQRVGRILRPEGLPPLVFDVVHPGLVSQWRSRAAGYRREFGVRPEADTDFAGACRLLRGA